MRRELVVFFVFICPGLNFAEEIINLTGKITNQDGKPIQNAIVRLVGHGIKVSTDADGNYTLNSSSVGVRPHLIPYKEDISLHNGILRLGLTSSASVKIELFDVQGNLLLNERVKKATPGVYQFNIARHINATRMMIIRAAIGGRITTCRYIPLKNSLTVQSVTGQTAVGSSKLSKLLADVDNLKVTADRYESKTVAVPAYEGTIDVSIDTLRINLDPFSFFITSLEGLQTLSGSENGFGGDLRFGHTGPGAGLRGADSICECLAEMSMPGSKVKKWRAFLSAEKGEDGQIVNAIDRIGIGPWYDRLGRLLANNTSELLNDRPINADDAIINDFPNEFGIPNHRPDPTEPEVDNHLTITGSNRQGLLYNHARDDSTEGFGGFDFDTTFGFPKQAFGGGFDFDSMGMSMGGEYPEKPTCEDWTSTTRESSPRAGFSWPQAMFGGGGFDPFDPFDPEDTLSKKQWGGRRGGMSMGSNWISAWSMSGCEPGIDLELSTGAGLSGVYTIGNGGGYGGFYCFALNP